MTLEEGDVERLSIAIAKALQQSRSVSDSEHYDHHRWIVARMEKEKAALEFWEEMKRHAAKFGMLSIITGLFYALVLAFREWIHQLK